MTEAKQSSSANQQPREVHIHNLTVLPPRQQSSSASDGIALPPLQSAEAVASLRGALSEIVGFGQLTKFRLVVEPRSGAAAASLAGAGKKKKGRSVEEELDPVINRHTLKDAVVSIPPTLRTLGPNAARDGELVLDDYGDLSVLVDLLGGSAEAAAAGDDAKIVLDASSHAVRVVLERYDAASVREQIGRVRALFAGNAPALKSLAFEEEIAVSAADAAEVPADGPHEQEVAEKKETAAANDDKEDKVSSISVLPCSELLL